MLKAATKARRHEESQRTFRVFVAAFFRELREPGVQPSGFSVVSAFSVRRQDIGNNDATT